MARKKNVPTRKRTAFIALRDAITNASELGVFDELQGYCRDTNAVNDVCDAIQSMQNDFDLIGSMKAKNMGVKAVSEILSDYLS